MILEGVEKNLSVFDKKKIFLICGKSFDKLVLSKNINRLVLERFMDFQQNPTWDNVCACYDKFVDSGCDTLLAVGGGSAIDVAKCVKHIGKRDIELIVVPTTAGSGSEATHFAVVYKDGEKISIADEALLPDIVILEPCVLETLPLYTRKSTMMDALCHAIESFWSIKSTPESRKIATKAIKGILENKEGYLKNTYEGNKGMLIAANMAGQAINMTTTTAAHAMAYKLTTMYGYAHGHAVAICLEQVWQKNKSVVDGISFKEYETILEEMRFEYPMSSNRDEDLEILTKSVNLQRLSNNPVDLNKDEIKEMYTRILK